MPSAYFHEVSRISTPMKLIKMSWKLVTVRHWRMRRIYYLQPGACAFLLGSQAELPVQPRVRGNRYTQRPFVWIKLPIAGSYMETRTLGWEGE